MRRIVLLVAAMAVVAPAGRAWAQGGGLEDLYGKTTIEDVDRQTIREWLAPRVEALKASTDPELKRMVAAPGDRRGGADGSNAVGGLRAGVRRGGDGGPGSD